MKVYTKTNSKSILKVDTNAMAATLSLNKSLSDKKYPQNTSPEQIFIINTHAPTVRTVHAVSLLI